MITDTICDFIEHNNKEGKAVNTSFGKKFYVDIFKSSLDIVNKHDNVRIVTTDNDFHDLKLAYYITGRHKIFATSGVMFVQGNRKRSDDKILYTIGIGIDHLDHNILNRYEPAEKSYLVLFNNAVTVRFSFSSGLISIKNLKKRRLKNVSN